MSPTVSRTTANYSISYRHVPQAQRRANGKFLADGVFYISTARLRDAGACGMASVWVMDALTGKGKTTISNRDDRVVTLNEKTVRRFADSGQAHRIEWIAYRLYRSGEGRSGTGDLTEAAYTALRDKFSYYAGRMDKRDRVEMIFAMLEVVARKRGLLPG